MKEKIKGVVLKYVTGYFVNTILVLLLCLVLSLAFGIDVFDSLLIGGATSLLIAFITMKSNSNVTPAVSPLSSSGSGDGYKGAAIINAGAESLTERGTSSERGVPVVKATLKFYILQRSIVELISYSVIIIGIGLIKYYSYF